MNAPIKTAQAGVAPTPRMDPRFSDQWMNIEDLRLEARRRLPKGVFEFMDRGSEDEATLRANRAGFQKIKLRNKVMVDVSRRDLSVNLFGKPMAMPLAIAPTGIAGLAWHEGELELARAAARSGVPFTLATPSITAIETIATVQEGRKWFQLYVWRDRAASLALVQRARDAGFEALIVTGDTPVAPIREYNRRNGFNSPFRFNFRIAADVAMHPRWMTQVLARYVFTTGMPKPVHHPKGSEGRAAGSHGLSDAMRGDDMTWDDVARLRDIWKGPMLVKGVHLPEDAEQGLKVGIDGVIVSNHGGRNLDTAVSPLDVLPEIVAAVGNKMTVLADSGVRRGSDVLKALALGAKAVLSGRPTLYGLACAGEAGAAHALGILRRELDTAMGYTGCCQIGDISERAIWRDRDAR